MKNNFEIRGDVTAIFLNFKGTTFETIIDSADLDKASQYSGSWYANVKCGKLYAVGKHTGVMLSLHRVLTDAKDGEIIDHINGDTLYNRRSVNLRSVTNAENIQNRRGAQSNSKSGIRGVIWSKQRNKWRAQLRVNGKQIHAGFFDDIHEAEKAVIEARKRHMKYSKDGV